MSWLLAALGRSLRPAPILLRHRRSQQDCPWILAHARVSRHIAEYCRAFMAGWDAWPASLPRLVWDTEPIAVAKTEVIAELARAYGTAPPLLGLFSGNGTTLPDSIHPPTDVEIRFSTPAMPQGRWVEQAWRCVFALEMPETLLLMLHPSAPPLNEGCWDDLLSTLLRSQLDVFVVLVWNGLNVDRLLPDHYFEGAPTRAPPIALAAYLESAVVDTLIALAVSVNQEDSQGHRPLA